MQTLTPEAAALVGWDTQLVELLEKTAFAESPALDLRVSVDAIRKARVSYLAASERLYDASKLLDAATGVLVGEEPLKREAS